MEPLNFLKNLENKHKEIINEMSFLRQHQSHRSMIAKNDEARIRATLEYISTLPDIGDIFNCLDTKKDRLKPNINHVRKSDILRACPGLSHQYKTQF